MGHLSVSLRESCAESCTSTLISGASCEIVSPFRLVVRSIELIHIIMGPESDTIFVLAVVLCPLLALLAAILLSVRVRGRRRSRAAETRTQPALRSGRNTHHRGAVRRGSHMAENSPNVKRPTPLRRNTELLFGFVQPDGGHIRCELRDHGEFGVEAQLLLDDRLYIARTFQGLPGVKVTARTLAIAWAERKRQQMERRAMATERAANGSHQGDD
jgi:hypothetical protein